MGAKRENTLVVDFSVLPKRPDVSAAQKFIYEEVKLDLADALNIQFHNVRNCVYIEMVDAATAKRYFTSHHLRHTMRCDKTDYKIPVFVEDEAVNVRIHDLPPRTPSTVIFESMRSYGTVLSISKEVWKKYFPGFYNGVRVVRMQLNKSIPSYLTIDGETTLVTYTNQSKTCKFCGQKAHPRQKCASSTSTTPRTTTVNNPVEVGEPAHAGDESSTQTLPCTSQTQFTTAETNKDTQQQQGIDEGNRNENSTDSESDEFVTVTNKRRLSTKKNNKAKRNETDQSCQNDGSVEYEISAEEMDDESAAAFSPIKTRSKTKQLGIRK